MTSIATVMPRLRPGVHPVRRDDTHLQVGLDQPRRVILRATPAAEHLLDALRSESVVPIDPTLFLDPEAEPLLRRLGAAGLLDEPAPTQPLRTVALDARGVDPAPLAQRLVDAGLTCTTSDAGQDAGQDVGLAILLAAAPLPRARVDEHVASGLPHLVICGTGRPGALRVGPFVEAGRTACLRCVDAHESEHDPRRGLVIEQLSRLPTPAPAGHDLDLALACAARDVVEWMRGGTPCTWSATLDLEPGRAPTRRSWQRHPDCGCAWDELPY